MENSCQMLNSSVAYGRYLIPAVSRHRKLHFHPKGTEPNITKLFSAIGSDFPLLVCKTILCDIF